jgi:hypothetical protein
LSSCMLAGQHARSCRCYCFSCFLLVPALPSRGDARDTACTQPSQVPRITADFLSCCCARCHTCLLLCCCSIANMFLSLLRMALGADISMLCSASASAAALLSLCCCSAAAAFPFFSSRWAWHWVLTSACSASASALLLLCCHSAAAVLLQHCQHVPHPTGHVPRC